MSAMNPTNGALKEGLTHLHVARLRRDGYSVSEIAAQLNVPPVRVRVVLSEALKHVSQVSVQMIDEYRAIELERLDVATKALMPKVEAGALDAIHTLVKVQQRRASLLGLDAPKEVITRNFVQDVSDIENIPTSELKRRLLEHMEQHTIDVTPERVPDAAPSSPSS